jgi:hypothetical protein
VPVAGQQHRRTQCDDPRPDNDDSSHLTFLQASLDQSGSLASRKSAITSTPVARAREMLDRSSVGRARAATVVDCNRRADAGRRDRHPIADFAVGTVTSANVRHQSLPASQLAGRSIRDRCHRRTPLLSSV